MSTVVKFSNSNAQIQNVYEDFGKDTSKATDRSESSDDKGFLVEKKRKFPGGWICTLTFVVTLLAIATAVALATLHAKYTADFKNAMEENKELQKRLDNYFETNAMKNRILEEKLKNETTARRELADDIKMLSNKTAAVELTQEKYFKNAMEENKELQKRLDNYVAATKINDCSKVNPKAYKSGNETRGVFEIYSAGKLHDVYCDLITDDGGWTVIQRRMDGSEDFFRAHHDYVKGFGNVSREFWLGLENIRNIVNSVSDMEMRIDMEDWEGTRKYAKYSRFAIGEPWHDYPLIVHGYSGTAGDSLEYHNGEKFSTKDHDVDAQSTENCALLYSGAWWYKTCHYSNLNGLYYTQGPNTPFGRGINWYHWKGHEYSLRMVEMKIRPLS